MTAQEFFPGRTLRFQKYATRLMILAWSIEGIAVAVGLAIAFSRVAGANTMGGTELTFWRMIQVSGGFVIVALAELTKIPLAVLLINVQNTLKPIILSILIFLSVITFETVFLSLEGGFNFQKSDLRTLKDDINILNTNLDLKGLEDKINEFDENNKEEQLKIRELRENLKLEKLRVTENTNQKIAEIFIADTSSLDGTINIKTTRYNNLSEKKKLSLERIENRFILQVTPLNKEIEVLEFKIKNLEENPSKLINNSKVSMSKNAKSRDEKIILEKFVILSKPIKDLILSLSQEKSALFDETEIPANEKFLEVEVSDLKNEQQLLREELRTEKAAIVNRYEKKRGEFASAEEDALRKKVEAESRGDYTNANKAQANVNKYQKLINRLAPATETKVVEEEFEKKFSKIASKLEAKEKELSEMKKTRFNFEQTDAEKRRQEIDEKISIEKINLQAQELKQRDELLKLAKRHSEELSELAKKDTEENELFIKKLAEERAAYGSKLLTAKESRQKIILQKQSALLDLDSEMTIEEQLLRSSLEALKEEKSQKILDYQQETIDLKNNIIQEQNELVAMLVRSSALEEESILAAINRNYKAQNETRDKRASALDEQFANEKQLNKLQTQVCNTLLSNQVYRIAGKLDVSWLFSSKTEKITSTYSYCPQQNSIDETNAERVAILWFGSIGLLSATAGIVTAIAGQMFVRMAENEAQGRRRRQRPSSERLLDTIRLLVVRWRKNRVKTVINEKIIEVPTEVVKEVEIIQEVEKIVEKEVIRNVEVELVIKELVPVPIFVPAGGDVDAELSKVKAHYEELNKKMASLVTPKSASARSKPNVRKTNATD